MQARKRQVHFAAFKGSYLGPMEPALIGKDVLGPVLFQANFANPNAQTALQFLPLHLQQFGGTLRKHILLIRRHYAASRDSQSSSPPFPPEIAPSSYIPTRRVAVPMVRTASDIRSDLGIFGEMGPEDRIPG